MSCALLFPVLLASGSAIVTAAQMDLAKARQHWAFQPIKAPPLPRVKNVTWPLSPIDFFMLDALEQASLAPLPPADKPTLIRRATYDLTGLPPTYEEIQDFLADHSSSAFEKVVERLLGSPAYGERWGRHWLDVVRYADTAGETADYPVPVAWRYRNYVIESFNNDKSYDEFLKEQIAGDILARSGPREKYAERVVATGFLALSRRFGFDSENYHHLTIQDTLDTLGQTALGLSLGCARCHDHKYDPIPAQDYYALYGIFQSARYSFPGSEQKQRRRALAPLIPPEESRPKWREFTARVAFLTQKLEKQKQPVPSALLESVDELDGDFEMQAAAGGGSRGVLVPPWFYRGEAAAMVEAQSPFQNVHPKGKVGAVLTASSNLNAAFFQAVNSSPSRQGESQFWLNLDFRLPGKSPEAKGARRFWVGSRGAEDLITNGVPAFEIIISSGELKLRTKGGEKSIRTLQADEWHNLQLTVDLKDRSLRGVAGTPAGGAAFEGLCSADWNGSVDLIAFDTDRTFEGLAPELQIDNFAILQNPIPPVSFSPPPVENRAEEQDGIALQNRLRAVVGIDGDFEFQADGLPPTDPWSPGPNSKVRIARGAQSPFRNIYPSGTLGVHLENSKAYDGFVQKFATNWKADSNSTLHASFDFRCSDQRKGGEGSWRFYLGHGAGASAAIEMFINGGSFFARDGENRIAVARIVPDEWHQVQLALNLRDRSYTGAICRAGSEARFGGQFAPSWDGMIDHAFIDSYGHLSGVRPALDVDNFALSEKDFAGLDAPPLTLAETESEARAANVQHIRQQLEQIRKDAVRDRQELEKLLTDGPMELAYAVVEGTPQDSPIQYRGEPDKLGPVVRRGFLSMLGGGCLPEGTMGSGRLELAEWLLSPGNPLTARVMVNRIWKGHFGRGLVSTPNDFGLRGQPPTHPELLDFLATEFRRAGWSIKAMHRLIMLSALYQQASAAAGDESASALYRGFQRRRLTAEEMRDAILLTSGALDRQPGMFHPFPSPFTWGYTQHGPFNAVYDHGKRSVYLMQQRIKRHPFLALFDGADPNSSVADRRTTTVPTQALFFLNDPFVHQKSEKLAADLLAAAPRDNGQRVEWLWKRALARVPWPEEKREALEFLEAYQAELMAREITQPEPLAFAALTRTLFGNNEFLHVD